MTMRIMVVEDEQIVALDLKRCLESLEYQVVALAATGVQAIQLASDLQPDLVLMDILLKGQMDGIQAAGQIRAKNDIPIVFLTAFSDPATLERAREAEPFGYIVKPFDERELAINIEMALFKNALDRKLRESESRYRGVIENASEGIALIDSQGYVIEWNPALEQISGLARADVLSQPIWDVTFQMLPREKRTPALLEAVTAQWQAQSQTGYLAHDRMAKHEIENPAGQRRVVQSNGFSIQTAQGVLGGVIMRDVTERDLAEIRETLRRKTLEKVIDLGKEVTGVTDLQQCLRRIHESVQHGLGFDRVGLFLYDVEKGLIKEMLGTDNSGAMIENCFYRASIHEDKAWEEIVHTPEGFRYLADYGTYYHQPDKPDMRGVKEHVVVSTWAGDQPVGFIAADNLLSQRPFTLDQLEALKLFAGYAGLAIQNTRRHEAVEKLVAERTVELEAANRELESLSYTIGHNLRSPIRAVVAYSHLLLEDLTDRLEASQEAKLRQVNQVAVLMGQMVDEYLTFLRLGRSAIRKNQLDMQAIARQELENLMADTPDREVESQISPMPVCEADERLMKIVYGQLLSNALKFTASRHPARIEAGALDCQGETHYFVRDNGTGFDMKHVAKLFGVFQRLHHADEFGGMGIGLAIVQRIIQRHGGRIWAEAAIDKGATFYFTLGEG